MKIIEKWQARHAQKLLEQAKHEVAHPRPRKTVRVILAWFLSLFVIATPFAVIAGGLALIIAKFPSIPATILGLMLIAFGYVLLPPHNRITQKTYRRADIPLFFDLLDQVANRLGTQAPQGVHFSSAFNAYMAQYRPRFSMQNEWILGIGFTLWTAATPDQRIALLAHELAHKVNDDPMRQGVFATAKIVLEEWYATFATGPDNGFIGNLVQLLGRGTVGGVLNVLNRLSYFESQRAEYRADAHAARVSGAEAGISLLELITRSDLARRAVVDLYPYSKNQNGRIFDHLGTALTNADAAQIDRFLAEAAAEKRCVDGSHPPTTMRIEFLGSLTGDVSQTRLDGKTVAFKDIDAELQPIKDQFGKAYMQALYDTEVNR